jgi:hypothetical protein
MRHLFRHTDAKAAFVVLKQFDGSLSYRLRPFHNPFAYPRKPVYLPY